MEAATIAGAASWRTGTDENAGAATQPLLWRRGITTRSPAQRFTERAGDVSTRPITSQYSWEPRPFSPTNRPRGSRLPSPGHRIYLPDRNALQIGNHAVHREHTIGGNRT